MADPGPCEDNASRLVDGEIARLYPRLFRTALRLVGNMERASDATQQAIYQALRDKDKFAGRSALGSWLHRILINCVQDIYRADTRSPRSNFDAWSLLPAPLKNDEPELSALREAIEGLPGTLRPAFVATVIDGYSYQEAAEMFNVPVGTIGSRVYEARRLVRQAMLETDARI